MSLFTLSLCRRLLRPPGMELFSWTPTHRLHALNRSDREKRERWRVTWRRSWEGKQQAFSCPKGKPLPLLSSTSCGWCLESNQQGRLTGNRYNPFTFSIVSPLRFDLLAALISDPKSATNEHFFFAFFSSLIFRCFYAYSLAF